jgi:hypothetical protein|uniref:DUF1097 domain-containing protein n=1 Tax=Altererythrobacter segetis TaxID=1104773 RepID=UPI00140E8959|nr:DUF1097 domain-containing protein [Altererythrobacter segetis]
MPALIALALSVGVLAVLDTWLYVGPLAAFLPGLVWISFIAWGCHFHSGGGSKGSITTVTCMSWGALVGMGAVMLAGGVLAGLGTLAAPVAVGLGAAVICLSSAIGLLQTIPASVYGFASIAGPILLANMAPDKAILPTVVSIIIGAAFGYVSEMLANALTKKGDVSAEATADPGHA